MAATAVFRMTEAAGLVPAKGTYDVAANVLLIGGTMVSIDTDGRADVITNGQNIAGVAIADVDNRTTAPEGGAAGALKCDVAFGVHGFDYDGTAPEPGQVVYALDNQTVTTDSNAGVRGVAGYCSEVRDGQCYVLMGPAVVGQIVIAATEAADLDQAQLDIAAAELDIAALEVDATSAAAVIELPLGGFADADGDMAKFADGGADGLTWYESKGHALRFNNAASPPAMITGFGIPADMDTDKDVIVKFLVAKTGATNNAANTTTITVGAYNQVDGALADADGDYGGATGAVVPNAPAKTLDVLSRTLASANLPAAGSKVSLTIKPTDGTLDTDDFLIFRAWVEYTRKLRAA